MKLVHQQTLSLLHQEAADLLATFAEAAIRSRGDFSGVEEAGHACILKLRSVVMSAGLTLSCDESRRTYHCPACQACLRCWSLPLRRIVTAEGEATYRPMRYRCVACEEDYYPLEEANGLAESQFTTGAQGLIAEAAAQVAFAHVSRWLLLERGLPVSAKEVDRTAREVSGWRAEEEEQLMGAVFGEAAARLRDEGIDPLDTAPALGLCEEWAEDTPVQISVDGAMVRSSHKGADGTLEWFEHRAGMIRPAREKDRGETTYLARVCSPDEMFDLLSAAARKAGHLDRRHLFLGDGSEWIWQRARFSFPDAIFVLDIYHAAEHVASAANAVWGAGTEESVDWRKRAREMLLDPGGPRRVLRTLLAELREPAGVADAEALKREIRYLFNHRHHMPYHALKKRGLPVGSGAMESAIKQLNSQRLRLPGMKWTRDGADAVLRLRAAHLSGTLQQTIQRRRDALMVRAQRYSMIA